MGLPRTLTFYVPEIPITLSDRDLERLLRELCRLDRPGALFNFAGTRDRIERWIAGERDGGRLDVRPGEDEALARALDNLRHIGPLGPALARLRDALLAWIRNETITYDLALVDATVETASLTSYTGPYMVDDHLPMPTEGRCWRIVAIEPNPDTDRDRLVCHPCEDEAHAPPAASDTPPTPLT